MPDLGLSCRHCSKAYGKTAALVDVTMQVRPGEIVGLVGPNGAGKTTLLHSIVGLAKLDHGSVTLDGVPMQSTSAKRRLAFMPDDLPRPRTLTAREVLRLTCRLYDVAFDEDVVDGLADHLEVQGRLDDMLSGFSHGMARKVDLIAALQLAPEVLVLDEPFSGMDPVAVDAICELLTAGRQVGRATLLSTHDLELASRISDRVVMLTAGHVVFDDSVQQLLDQARQQGIREAFRAMSKSNPRT